MNAIKRLSAGILLAVLALPGRGAGPAEIDAIRTQIQATETEIAVTESRFKTALQGYGESAGDLSVRLRTLKREHALMQQQLKQAIDAEQERETVSHAMPSPQRSSRQSPPVQTPGRQPGMTAAPVTRPTQ